MGVGTGGTYQFDQMASRAKVIYLLGGLAGHWAGISAVLSILGANLAAILAPWVDSGYQHIDILMVLASINHRQSSVNSMFS